MAARSPPVIPDIFNRESSSCSASFRLGIQLIKYSFHHQFLHKPAK